MPQVDLETLVSVCAGGSSDRKIACETLAATDDQPDHPPEQPESVPPDFPPESFCLSKDDELEWFDRNAFYERKESQKGNSNSNSTNLNPSSNSGSQRFALKSKASILGLPKPQKAYVDTKNRRNCKPANARLFPKRSGSVGKTDPPLAEPSSPKVSCMGRVRSKRDKNKRMKDRQKSENRQTSGEKPVRKGKSGFLASFRAIFWTGCKEASARESKSLPAESPRKRKSAAINNHDIRSRLPPDDVDAIPAESPPRKSEARQSLDCEPVGLGGMKRFASARSLVAVPPIGMQTLAVVPLRRRSGHSEFLQRRVRRPFSVSEVEALVQAVEKLGTGRWRDVKLCAFDNAKHRTYVDLKDKWKTLVHTARISPQQRRGEPVPQELLDRVLDAHAYWSQQLAKHQIKAALL